MKFYRNLLWGALFSVALTGCIDDKYDLSDIDTTSEIKIKDLVLPVNLDPVYLNDIITVEDDDKLNKVTINGQTFYAVQESGTFESDGIEVNSFSALPDAMNPQTATFHPAAMSAAKRRAAALTKTYSLDKPVDEDLDYRANDVSSSVRDITKIFYKNLSFRIMMSTADIPSDVASHLDNLSIQLPKGLSIVSVTAPGYTYKESDYIPSSGILTLGSINFVDNESYVDIMSNSIAPASDESSFIAREGESGSFSLLSKFTILQGCSLILESENSGASMPEAITYNVSYNVDPLEATAFLGDIQYDLEGTGLAIEPINLDDLPDFLADDETNLILANPQIYLNLDNPVGIYSLGYQSGLTIISKRDDGSVKTFPLSPDGNNNIEVPGRDGSFNFLLAQNVNGNLDVPSEYADLYAKLTYNDLGSILAGEGLPSQLDIELVNPMIERQTLKEPFLLDTELPGMKGTYQFLAPLALTGNSKIVYTKTEDGWWSEDLEALTITNLQLSTVASSDVPLDAVLAVYPLDKDGNRISGLDIKPLTLPANAKDVALTFDIIGTITDLDGVFITATVTPDGTDEVLSPNQNIVLKNLKAKVSGNYTKKF